MDPKGGNPFLMDDYSAGADAAMAPPSNPFLDGFGDPGADAAAAPPDANPFFGFGAPDQTAYQPPAGDSTNPFASFGMETAAVPEPETGVFVNPEEATVPEPNLLGEEEPTPAPEHVAAPAKPARPPPPPRPTPPPPPRNTKDLILSVTGAMDETSNQMLDRLQANRTPSPTLMHSPSPTPEHSYSDLLDVDGSVPDMAHDAAQQPQTPGADDKQAQQQQEFGQDLYNAAPPVQEEPPVATADKTDDAPPVTSTLTENPFSDVGQTEVQAFGEPVYDQKRPSLIAASPVVAGKISSVPGTDISQSLRIEK